MKRVLAATLLIVVAFSLATGQSSRSSTGLENSYRPELTLQQSLAGEELIEAARAYKAGKFREAELHVRRALEFDPENKDAPFYLARSIHAQYKVDVGTPENREIAERAIEAYKRILAKDANNDESFKAIAFLLVQLGKRNEQVEWVKQRAENESVAPEKRSEAYVFLASREWECSFQVTERKENQKTVERGGKLVIAFKRPKDLNVFNRARQCALRGMEFVERAITLNSESNKAWGYKTNLLLELAKLSEMGGNAYDRDEYKRRADEAQKRTVELYGKALRAERARENEVEGDVPPQPPPPVEVPLPR